MFSANRVFLLRIASFDGDPTFQILIRKQLDGKVTDKIKTLPTQINKSMTEILTIELCGVCGGGQGYESSINFYSITSGSLFPYYVVSSISKYI